MKISIILLILLASVLFMSGCDEKTQYNSTDSIQNISENSAVVKATQHEQINSSIENDSSRNISGKGAVVEATKLEQINSSLKKGPVLLKIGAVWCDACQEMEPMLAQLAAEYEDNVTVMTVDIDKSPKLADYFGINVIPDTSVIVGIKKGEYVYMREDGNVSTDRFKARILKLEDKEVFEKTLNFALKRGKIRSK
jgi:thioredoxin 1